MNLAVTGLASVIPQGKGIECLNYHLYEGAPIVGRLDDKYYQEDYLLNALIEQFPSDSDDLRVSNIILKTHLSNNENNALTLDSLKDALLKAKELCLNENSCVRIFLMESCNELSSESVQDFSLASEFKATQKASAHYGIALQLENLKQEKEGGQFFYAVLEDIAWRNVSQVREDISDNFQNLLFNVEINSQAIDVLEWSSEAKVEEFDALKSVMPLQENAMLKVALSGVATSFGYGVQHLEFISLIKAVLQCYHRYQAGVPEWKTGNELFSWESSPFYINEQSRSWFVSDQDVPRYALVHHLSDKQLTQILVSDREVGLDRDSQYFAYACPHLIPFSANDLDEFLSVFSRLENDLENCHSQIQLRRLAKNYYQNIIDAEDAIDIKHYRAALLAENKEALFEELNLLRQGVEAIFKTAEKHEIKTPKGSYFTLEPLGEEGKLAFVFPGLGSSYIGLGQKIFQLFPSIFKESFRFTKNVGEELQEKVLYPRTQNALSFKEKRQRDMDIVMNLKDLGKTDTTYSSICAHVMTDVFKVKPDVAFGHSMGEANMMTALDVWQTPTELEDRFKSSEIFKNKLYGNLETVKKFWAIDAKENAEHLWGTFTLKATKEQVESCIQENKLEKVYLTLINTDDNVVIAGNPIACMTLVQKLNCRAIPMGFVPAIHCEITAQEYEGIAQLYSMPTTESSSTKLYSSSCYLPVPVRQKAIAYAIAKCFCEPVDFPRLVNKVYQDGARIFLEAGAGRTCSTWIDKILHGQKHVIVPLNAKGTEDSLTFARVMAKLFCHKVDVSLHPLYENVK